MAGTSQSLAGTALNGGGGGVAPNSSGLSASELNSFRISAVIDRLSLHFHTLRNGETFEFLNLCLSLARGIDFAIANHEVPRRSQDLPLLIKQVCQGNNDTLQQAAVMVLMISIKNACQNGWFSDSDSEDLKNLAKEIAGSFCSVSDLNTEPSSSLSVISTIMSRFYPRMKMGHILAFVEVKPGFEAYVTDFQISKTLKPSSREKIRLFVVQTDSIETSSCLITPPKANFLLNGKGVEKRNNLCMDPGAQIPTVVTHFLKYGSNLLQAVGEFNGNYIVAVAFMSEMPNPDSNTLQEYEQHAPATVDADSEIIEGPSRISLNCPISFTRIKTPIKGHSCKHIQCFDFDNYVDMNSRRPSWRCPHCNQHVCFTDIRIDQKMVKVLEKVGPDVSDIIFSSDGSWTSVMESNDSLQQKPDDKTDKTLGTNQDNSPQPEDVLDLTLTDDAMNIGSVTHETAISPTPHQNQFMTLTVENKNDVNQSSGHLDNDFWSGIYMSTFGQGSSNARPDISNYIASPPVLTNSIASPNREAEAFHGNNALGTPSLPQNGNTSQLQQYQSGNPTITSSEYGRFPSFPRNVTRTPTAVQALPAQTPTSVLQQTISPRNNVNSMPHASPHQVSQMSSSSLYQRPVVQQNRSFPSAQPPQQNIGVQAPNHLQNAYRFPNERQNSVQPMENTRTPRVPVLNQSSVQSSGSFLRPQNHVGVSQTQQSHLIASANRSVHMAIDPSRIAAMYSMNAGDQRANSGISSPPVTSTDTFDPTADMNWRPATRMRGALSGQAYADALNQYIIRPSQQSQSQGARPISNVTSVPTNVPPQLQTFMGGPGRPGGSNVLPGMH